MNNNVPPLAASYQVKVPATGEDAPMLTVPLPQRLALIAVTDAETTYAVAFTRALVQVPEANST